MREYPVHACTDITGFGLIGHLAEMMQGTGLGLRIVLEKLPIIDVALGLQPWAWCREVLTKTGVFGRHMVDMDEGVDPAMQDILYRSPDLRRALHCRGADFGGRVGGASAKRRRRACRRHWRGGGLSGRDYSAGLICE
jgi:hypothetical protein